MGFLDETGLKRVWERVKAEFAGLTNQIAKSYPGTATEAIQKDTVFFSNNTLRVALTNIALGDTINDANSQIKKLSDLLGGANMSEILKSVYVSPQLYNYYDGKPDNQTAKAVLEAFRLSANSSGIVLITPTIIDNYRFLAWNLPPQNSTNILLGTLSDGREAAITTNNYTNSISKAIAIYVKA